MPVFFYLDPELLRDPLMKGIETVTLNYTFFSKCRLLPLFPFALPLSSPSAALSREALRARDVAARGRGRCRGVV